MPDTRTLLIRFALVLGVALGYWATGWLAFAGSVSHHIVTLVVFGAEGLALGCVLRWGSWAALGVFLGQLGLALTTGLPLLPSLAVSGVNAAECLLGGWLARRIGLDPDLDRLRDVLMLLGMSALVLQPFSAILGVGSLWGLGRMPASAVTMSAFSWWLGNTLGQSILAPVVLVLSKPLRTWFPGPLLAFVLVLILGLTAFGALGSPGLPSFALALALFFPVVVLSAVRLGVEGGALASLGLAVATVTVTKLGRGPFLHSWTELDLFLVGGTFTALGLGALFTERRRMESVLRRQNEALELAFADLSKALAEVQTLEGFLPICAYCKQVRDDQGYWAGIEHYLAQRSHLSFTHGICPNCRSRFLGEAGAEGLEAVPKPSA